MCRIALPLDELRRRCDWDMVCEQGHGCAPIPFLQRCSQRCKKADPRCVPLNELTQDDKDALTQLQDILKKMQAPASESAKAAN
ncbi:MAG: hypothetical protein M0P39_07005 [Rhodocyclaceae bacterium]|jgi:hypothetical protein|nr:hypothetical protein [Rhodocyclaceae bacterium]